jgi:polyribonucleotide nucleotidyltransferase
MILDPPTAEVGATYPGKVVNITKFGAFVSILPGRDGLLHISKMSPLNDGKRIGQVEDVLSLGQAIEVRVDDIDPQGKVSLSLAGEFANSANDDEPREHREPREPRERREPREPRERRDDAPARNADGAGQRSVASFEASFEAELADEIGDLGPGGPSFSENDGGERRRPRPRRR